MRRSGGRAWRPRSASRWRVLGCSGSTTSQSDCARPLEDLLQAVRVVGVLVAVHRREHVARGVRRCSPRGSQHAARSGRRPEPRRTSRRPPRTRVAGRPSRARFSTATSRRGEQQRRQVVGHHAVDLLGHAAVERAQARLDVGDRHVQLGRGERSGQRGVRVAVDEHPSGARRPATCSIASIDAAGLLRRAGRRRSPGCTAAAGYRSSSKKTLRHVGVVVLPGVDDRSSMPRCRSARLTTSRLDELRPGADDGDDSFLDGCLVDVSQRFVVSQRHAEAADPRASTITRHILSWERARVARVRRGASASTATVPTSAERESARIARLSTRHRPGSSTPPAPSRNPSCRVDRGSGRAPVRACPDEGPLAPPPPILTSVGRISHSTSR